MAVGAVARGEVAVLDAVPDIERAEHMPALVPTVPTEEGADVAKRAKTCNRVQRGAKMAGRPKAASHDQGPAAVGRALWSQLDQ
jgi:hypothetical protein